MPTRPAPAFTFYKVGWTDLLTGKAMTKVVSRREMQRIYRIKPLDFHVIGADYYPDRLELL